MSDYDTGLNRYHQSTDDQLSALSHWRANSETDQGKLPMPPIVYTSEDIFNLETQKIFNKEWVCVGHTSELQQPGDYITFDLVGHPVLIVRDRKNEIRAYSNVCPHRSGRLASGSGNIKIITCPYHAWSFELQGNLRGAPGMDKVQVRDVCLNELNFEIWQGLIFVNLDPGAEPLSPRLAPLLDHIEQHGLAARTMTFTKDGEFDCNWKVLVENFCESYHVFKVHRKTLEPNTPTSTVKILPGGIGFNHHTMDVVTAGQDEDNRDHICCIYPSMTLSIGRQGALWLSIIPLSSKRLRYRLWLATDMNAKHGPELNQLIQSDIERTLAFMAEDAVIITGVQQGLESGVGSRGPLNDLEKTNWEFGHYYAQRMLD